MSYDVSIKLPIKGAKDKWIEVAELGNITWNVRKLIFQSSGWAIKNEASNGEILPWLKLIEHGIKELQNNPDKYKQYESPNGWGTVNGTLNFYRNCYDNATEWIRYNEQLLPYAVIWVW